MRTFFLRRAVAATLCAAALYTIAHTALADDMIVVDQGMLPDAQAAGPAAPDTAAQPPAALSKTDKISYIFGFNMGANLKEYGIDVNEAMIIRGLQEGLANPENPSLSREEIRATMQDLNKEIAEKQKARLAAWQAQSKDRGKHNRSEGDRFLKENKQKEGVVTTRSGLQYVVMREGEGPRPGPRDTVKVVYSGRLLDGTEFDSTEKHGKPLEMSLTRAIDGWKEGITLMKTGSKYRFFIPHDLAYGSQGQPGSPIYPYAVLVFDIELLGIVP